MLDFLMIAGVATILFFAIDIVWLAVIAKKLYQTQLKDFMAEKVNWVAAIIFYFIFILGLTYFVIIPAAANASIVDAVINGAMFGFVCYATYDLTNLATLKNWPLKITIIDLVWGTTISTLVSLLTYLILV